MRIIKKKKGNTIRNIERKGYLCEVSKRELQVVLDMTNERLIILRSREHFSSKEEELIIKKEIEDLEKIKKHIEEILDR